MSDTVIVIQEERILAVSGKAGPEPVIQHVEQIPLGMAGKVSEIWKEALQKYMEQHDPDHVRLVLPTAYSSSRVLQMPYASGKTLDKMAKNMLQENAGDGLSDYGVVLADKKNGVTLCCAQVGDEAASGLMQIVRDIDMPVSGMTVPIECYLRLITRLREHSDRAVIYLIFEENSVTSLLFQAGRYLYSTRSRIFSERGTLDFGTEIERSISGILQFYSTTRSDVPVTDVFYAGCAQDDFEVSSDRLRSMNLNVHPIRLKYGFSGRGAAEDYIVCFGALLQDRKKTVNFVDILQKKENDNPNQTGLMLLNLAKAPMITAIVCLAAFVAVSVPNLLRRSQVDEINAWIDNAQNQADYADALLVEAQKDQWGDTYRQIAQMQINLETYPELTNSMRETIIDASGSDLAVEIESLNLDTGLLTFNAVSGEVIDIPSYVQKLENTGLFDSVNYSGYSYDEGKYTLMLSCVLKADEIGGDAS